MSLQILAALEDGLTGSEPKSDDGDFIDDMESPIDSIALIAKAIYLAISYSARDAAEITKGCGEGGG